MKYRPLLPLLAWFALLLVPLLRGQEAAPCGVDLEQVERAWGEVLASAGALGIEREQAPALRLATREELRVVLLEENRPLMRAQIENEHAAEAEARVFASSRSHVLLAKFALDTDEVLVCAENFASLAELLGQPELCAPATLRAVLVHELVHAADQRRYDFTRVLRGLSSGEAISAYLAVIEGHAQLVARRIAAERGWSAGFEVFEGAIGALPAGVEGGENSALYLLLKIQAATEETSYLQGERFMAAVERQLGPEGIRRAFERPPSDMSEVFEPDWYIRPQSRPAARHDLEAGLSVLSDSRRDTDWQLTRLSLTPAQVQASAVGLPPEVVLRMARVARTNRVLLAVPPGIAHRQVSLALFSCATPADARFFWEANERVVRMKDAIMKSGPVRVLGSQYEEVEREDFKGVYCEKLMSVNGQDQTLVILTGSSGSLAIDVSFLNESADLEELVALALQALERARNPPPAAQRADEPAAGPDEDPDEDAEDEAEREGGAGGWSAGARRGAADRPHARAALAYAGLRSRSSG